MRTLLDLTESGVTNMRSTRWLGTVAYTLFTKEGKEYIFERYHEDDSLDDPLTYRETDQGVQWLDEHGIPHQVSWDEIRTEIES